MSIYAYRVFDQVVRSGSFVQASEKLNLSASAVSHMIKGLENEFGFPLFKRNRAGAVLTSEGERIAPYIASLLKAEENILQEVSRINDHNVGTVSIGMFASVASGWFVKILRSFKEKYPGIDVVIWQGSYEDVIRWLEEKKVDLAFTTDEIARGMDFLPLKQDSLICITSGDFVPRNVFSVNAFDLKENDLIINSECETYDARNFLKKNGIRTGTYYDTVELQTLFAMVNEGMGICIVPELVAMNAPASIRKYPIIGNPSRTIGLTFPDPKNPSPAALLLRDEIVEFVKEY